MYSLFPRSDWSEGSANNNNDVALFHNFEHKTESRLRSSQLLVFCDYLFWLMLTLRRGWMWMEYGRDLATDEAADDDNTKLRRAWRQEVKQCKTEKKRRLLVFCAINNIVAAAKRKPHKCVESSRHPRHDARQWNIHNSKCLSYTHLN